ncbi:MAG: hypothetical protein Q9M31_05085 [Mariprofundus sp.]|nr:hypothetical protein [Mariprofundus sp.]
MQSHQQLFSTPEDWYEAAQLRTPALDQTAIMQRQGVADAYNSNHNISDAAVLADQQLYIQGYMEIEEYQDYLFLKHSQE